MTEVVVGIHQPNFLPWLGFFHKLASSDVFVLLDSVQFSRGSRTNRVQVLAGDRPTWLTVPVRRPEHGEPRIADALIDDSRPWRRKALRTLEVSYGSLDGFEETYELVGDGARRARPTGSRELNEGAIAHVSPTRSGSRARESCARPSSDADGAGSELLAGLVAAVGGTVYLSGAGAGGYHDERAVRRPRDRGPLPALQPSRLRAALPRARPRAVDRRCHDEPRRDGRAATSCGRAA